MYFSVKQVEAKPDYLLLLTFENGEKREFDMKPYLNKGIFKDLRDERMFRTAHVSFNSVTWDNEADFDPEALYDGSLPLDG
jgi:hypothetical protein